ncbi:MAG: hypothetical protein II649_08155 [Kiritimatiellae bacterium]|nr:hypothetical protein [Kiritimatiellia bacterium]
MALASHAVGPLAAAARDAAAAVAARAAADGPLVDDPDALSVVDEEVEVVRIVPVEGFQ